MTPPRIPLAPTSLPPPRCLPELPASVVLAAVANLRAIYCPLAPSAADIYRHHDRPPPPQADSGYTSGNDDGALGKHEAALESLRADALERDVAFRWLSTVVLRADELQATDDERDQLVDEAEAVIAALTVTGPEAADECADCDDGGITRDFSFPVAPELDAPPVRVCLFDADLSGPDHLNVGLQSWGAPIVFSALACAAPARLRLTRAALGPSPCVVELGAGTGLVGLVLGALLPRLGIDATVVATDYHPAVLANLASNVAANQGTGVRTCILDWADPVLSPPLPGPRGADLLVATDVVYEAEHALLLRGCAARLLSPRGVFLLVATVRADGRFAGISDTVEMAFNGGSDQRFIIQHTEMLPKQKGVGRGDEDGYKLFKIGWATGCRQR
ncbi:hypothetical protein RB594_000021 [Gaeumannomyces avenae]